MTDSSWSLRRIDHQPLAVDADAAEPALAALVPFVAVAPLRKQADEIAAQRPEATRREDVDDAAPTGERSCFDHRVLPPVAGAVEVLEEHVHEQFFTDANLQALAVDHFGGGDGVDEGRGRKEDGPHRAVLQGQGRLRAFVVFRSGSGPTDPGRHIPEGCEGPRGSEPGNQGFRVARKGFKVFLVRSDKDHESIRARERDEKAREAEEAGDPAGAALVGRAFQRQEPRFPVKK